jgi:excinuclease ABC subunit B
MFKLVSDFSPAGDQPEAIEKLTKGVLAGVKYQTLLGVTGSGKTFTIANVIANVNRPVLVISHNKTLAAQLFAEFKNFFPYNAVEYFISYFDYYQPEAYIPQTDTYIEKDSSINQEIERLRLSTMSSLFSRRDVIVVASVSCIYGIGSKDDFEQMSISIKTGQNINRQTFLEKLVSLQYERNDIAFERGQFRVRGDTVDVRLAYRNDSVRIEFFGDTVERISQFDPVSGKTIDCFDSLVIYPAKQFITPMDKIRRAVVEIRHELEERLKWFEMHGKLLEAQRLKMRTEYDIEMMLETGYCSGIENYSRHLSGRPPGSRPCTLLDFFPQDYLLIIDESHATIPQLIGMAHGDQSRKKVLVEFGFRLPSALDNRPLFFEEFQKLQGQTIFMSATPGERELKWSNPHIVEQIVRPTGLVDPIVNVKPLKNQIDDLIFQIRKRVDKHERVLVTTLTKRTAEELTDYLREIGINVRYLHSEIDALERVEILRDLRLGNFDVLVGINLLREGLDLPEVSLVAILDGDKEGFLRSTSSLIQTAGRAARHVNGEVVIYADTITDSIKEFLSVTEYRRKKQIEYNKKHNITPKSVVRAVEQYLSSHKKISESTHLIIKETNSDFDIVDTLRELEQEMIEASNRLEFEKAAILRDQIQELKQMLNQKSSAPYEPQPPTAFKRLKKSKSQTKFQKYNSRQRRA